tara:strand:- start:241 stop:828 length:588 start_codon:yes stop_codon:yes gene_type:complete
MKELLNRIRNLFHYGRYNDNSKETYDHRILEIPRGKSFKGHEVHMHVGNYNEAGDTELYFCQSYLSGHVQTSYNSTRNTTKTIVNHHYVLPKWMIKKIKDIKSKQLVTPNCEYILKLDNGLEVAFDEYCVKVQKKEHADKLVMRGHRNNIEKLKELKQIGSRFRKYFKTVDINELITSTIQTEDEHRYEITKFSL